VNFAWGTGHIPDPVADAARARERPITRLAGVSPYDVPDRGSLARFAVGPAWDQGPSQSCVWQASCRAMFLRGRAEFEQGIGPGITVPSVMQAWTLAQWKLQELQDVPIEKRIATNQGSSVHAGNLALRESGIVSEARWPFDVSLLAPNANGDVILNYPLDVDIAAADALLTGDYGASSVDYPTVARAAMQALHFPVQAMDLDASFFDLRGPEVEYRGPQGRPVVGRHMMLACEWRPGWIRYLNSWGSNWGDNGTVWISDDYTSSFQAMDGAVFTAAPPIAA
jgi:hypothetical protein